ncbi:rho guanine nucleotide exchange factor 10-like protein [Trichonephila clavipes]|nr:rho guanine nucleotide exchange factor 10-like protein [Trichonephila clavipes]
MRCHQLMLQAADKAYGFMQIQLFNLSKRGEAEFLVTKNGTMCARWLDSKEVIVLSNCHEAKYAKVNRTIKDGNKELECPVAIEFYNKIMGGVDFADQMANVYELDRKSCKW